MCRILLGMNCNCFTNRFDEPEEWTRICADLGIGHVMFNVDLIDPYWPWDLQRRLCDQTLEACSRRGIMIHSSFGGHHGHQHYLGHPDPGCRAEAEDFFRRAICQTAYLGGSSFGTCFAILTERCQTDSALRRQIIEDAIGAYHRLAVYAAEQGLRALTYETTSVPRESCSTFAENDYVIERCADMAVPMRLCLDMGHRNLAALPAEADHLAWIRRYGRLADVIDCQQTDLEARRHWLFTPEFNARGVIEGSQVVSAIKDSGAKEVLLAFEIRTPAYHPQEYTHLNALRASVDYWRHWVKE
jgi:D-erythrulose 1-phosphate 3-epimerase